MSEEIKFKYFYNGKQVEKSEINWESDITVKVEFDNVYVTSTGHLSTRHKHPPGGYNKEN